MGIEVSQTAYAGDILGFLDGFPSSVGGVVLLLLLFEMFSCGRLFCPMFSGFWVLMRKGGKGLSESNHTTPVCPQDVANSRAVLPRRSGMLGLGLLRSHSKSTIPGYPCRAAY